MIILLAGLALALCLSCACAQTGCSAAAVCLWLQVHVVSLNLAREEAARRYSVALAAAAQGLEAQGSDLADVTAVLGVKQHTNAQLVSETVLAFSGYDAICALPQSRAANPSDIVAFYRSLATADSSACPTFTLSCFKLNVWMHLLAGLCN